MSGPLGVATRDTRGFDPFRRLCKLKFYLSAAAFRMAVWRYSGALTRQAARLMYSSFSSFTTWSYWGSVILGHHWKRHGQWKAEMDFWQSGISLGQVCLKNGNHVKMCTILWTPVFFFRWNVIVKLIVKEHFQLRNLANKFDFSIEKYVT